MLNSMSDRVIDSFEISDDGFVSGLGLVFVRILLRTCLGLITVQQIISINIQKNMRANEISLIIALKFMSFVHSSKIGLADTNNIIKTMENPIGTIQLFNTENIPPDKVGCFFFSLEISAKSEKMLIQKANTYLHTHIVKRYDVKRQKFYT